MSRILVLTSGGVDSSVALLRLAEEGRHSLEACYLKIWLSDEMAILGRCPWEEDLSFVRSICERLGVPLRVLPLQREYFATVVAYAIDELRAGRTPSPDVICNRAIKFGAVVDLLGDEFELFASGHHARVDRRDGLARLLRGVDPVKDQTYFLCRLSQQQLARSLYPIGGMTKAEVRAEARRAGLPNQDRPDSQGICFLGRVPYDDFVEFELGAREGEIVEHGSGRVLGRHRGYWFHTIGQRRGLGLAGGPWYVVAKDPERNLVTVVHADRLAEHRRTRFRIAEPSWIAGPPDGVRLEVRIRHGELLLPCTVELAGDGAVEIELDEGDTGIAAGQFAALYHGEECLGGGPITVSA